MWDWVGMKISESTYYRSSSSSSNLLKFGFSHNFEFLDASLTCLVDIHSPVPTADQVLVSTAPMITLIVIHNNVWWGWSISAEAFFGTLDPSISVALALLPAPSDALSWGVIGSKTQIDVWQHSFRRVYYALPLPGNGARSWILTYWCYIHANINNKNTSTVVLQWKVGQQLGLAPHTGDGYKVGLGWDENLWKHLLVRWWWLMR